MGLNAPLVHFVSIYAIDICDVPTSLPSFYVTLGVYHIHLQQFLRFVETSFDRKPNQATEVESKSNTFIVKSNKPLFTLVFFGC